MTICIATRCTENNSFIVAGDRLFSYGMDALDSMSLKRVLITPDHRWHTMFAASPVSNVMPIIRRIRHLLATSNHTVPYDLEPVRERCVLAYQNQRERLVNERILSVYGTNLAKWGVEASNFGASEVREINDEIRAMKVGVELIVFGYDSRNVAHMFTVVEPGTSKDYDIEGVAIVGSGGGYAQKSLISRDLPFLSQAEMMCRVLEAKYEAEKNANVGHDSCAGVVNQPNDNTIHSEAPERYLCNAEMLAVRAAIQSQQTNPYPDDVIKAVQRGIDSAVTSAQIERAVDDLMKQVAARQK